MYKGQPSKKSINAFPISEMTLIMRASNDMFEYITKGKVNSDLLYIVKHKSHTLVLS
jgi:hypothetical protein